MAQKSSDRAVLAELGALIRRNRLSRGLSQEELAFASRLDRSYVGGVERGERNISFVNLLRLTRALGISLPNLLADFRDHDAATRR